MDFYRLQIKNDNELCRNGLSYYFVCKKPNYFLKTQEIHLYHAKG